MCVILGCVSNKPSLDILRKCHSGNSDGAGIVWFNDTDKAQYKKGLTLTEVVSLIKDLPLPFVIHFRAASTGTAKGLLLTHPFEITATSELKFVGEANQLLIHNGFFPDWRTKLKDVGFDVQKEPETALSDTRALAIILANKGVDYLKTIIKGRFIVADATLKKFRCFGEDFKRKDGIYYSNMFWEHRSIDYTPSERSWEFLSKKHEDKWKKMLGKIPPKQPKNFLDVHASEIVKGECYIPPIMLGNKMVNGVLQPVVFKKVLDHPPKTREEQVQIIEAFNVPLGVSKKKQKKAFKKFCKINELFCPSWRDAVEIWKDRDERKQAEMQTDGRPLVSGIKMLTQGCGPEGCGPEDYAY